VDGREIETTAAIGRVQQLFARRDGFKPRLVEQVAAAQRMLREEFRRLLITNPQT
jgi:hypothetical protein